MSGVLFGISLSQRWDVRTNLPATSARLYLYQAGTSTPVIAYKNAGLTAGQEHPNPVLTDTFGIIPAFFLADGDYRVRLVSSDGAVIFFDVDNVPAVGASSGGGGVDTTDPHAIAATGDFTWQPVSGARAGWVRANARTIGSATSGASERANADCENLFLFLWTTFSDTLCPVTSGRGGSAAADWAANKKIAVLDMRGVGGVGLADMGNSDSTRLDSVTFAVGDKTTAASICGEALHTLSTAELAAHTHVAHVTDPGHTHTTDKSLANLSSIGLGVAGGSGAINNTATIQSATTGITVSNDNAGSGTAHNNMQPSRTGSWYVRL